MKSETALWFMQAEQDLEVAKKNLKLKEWYVSAFLSQQAAEKALKAVYIKKFNDLIKVHDLVFLGRKVGVSEEILKGCGYLSRAYIESRYPGDFETPSEKFSEEEALKCIRIADEVLKWAKKIL